MFSLAFICLPWFSYSYFSAGINFNDGTTELNIPETAGEVTLYGIASNSGIISFLMGLLAIGISYFNRWLPGNTLKVASCLIAPVVFIIAWAYFFNVAGDATGIDVRTASMSADASFGPGFWLFLVSSIALAGLAVTTDWTRHKRPVHAGSPEIGPAAEQGTRSGQSSLHKWVFAVILPIIAMMILCGGLLSQMLSLFESANESMQNLDALNQDYESSPAEETGSDSPTPPNPEPDSGILMHPPFNKSWMIDGGRMIGGQYPGTLDPVEHRAMLHKLMGFGITHIINLQHEDETASGIPFRDYMPLARPIAAELGQELGFRRFAIEDQGTPTAALMTDCLDHLDAILRTGAGHTSTAGAVQAERAQSSDAGLYDKGESQTMPSKRCGKDV